MDLFWSWCASTVAVVCLAYACMSSTFDFSLLGLHYLLPHNVESSTKKSANGKRRIEKPPTTEIDRLKELFLKLHHLERFYDDIFPNVAPILCDMISEALDDAMLRENRGILDVDTYSREILEEFMQGEYDVCMRSWEDYNKRRQAGGARELYLDREDASNSIRRLAPLRLVDGAWLSHVNKLSTPIGLRQSTQKSWQILSEELGDGDLRKNHVYVYRDLIRETSSACPEPHSPLFIDSQYNMADVHVWKAAVAQQLISVLPDKFMPEVLGFSLHFEGVAYDTLVTTRELRELGYDPSYYLLHVSIDNPHSGHSAIALEAVNEYLEFVQRELGAEDFQVAWNRVRAGYVLSEYLNGAANRPQSPAPHGNLTPCEEAVVKIIAGKAPAAHKIHCGSRSMVGGLHINHWLDKERLRERTWQTQFLRALSNTGSLVRRGQSGDSRLVKELSWGGKMFGSFTDLEVTAVRQWIDGLSAKQGKSYWSFTGLPVDQVPYDPRKDSQCWTNAFYSRTPLIDQALHEFNDVTFPFNPCADPLKVGPKPDFNRLLPLWFAGLSLLENFVSVPSKVANEWGCAILRVLRAQHGFGVETDGVGGLDEAMRSDRVDLIDIGLDLMDQAGIPRPQRLDTMLQGPDAAFARELVVFGVRPEKHADVLVGFSCAFVELHQAMVPFMSESLRGPLEEIAARERRGLGQWLAGVCQSVRDGRSTLCKAYGIGRREIAACF